MRKFFPIFVLLFQSICFAQNQVEIDHGQYSFYLRTVVDHAEAGSIVYHEPLFFFLQDANNSNIFYKRRDVAGPQDSISLYLLLTHNFLKEKIQQDPLYEDISLENIRSIPLKRILINIKNTNTGKSYECIMGNPNEFLVTNDILQANFLIPDQDVQSILEAIQDNKIELAAYYIYPATLYKYEKISISREILFPEKIIQKTFENYDFVYVTDFQLDQLLMNANQAIKIFGYFENVEPSDVQVSSTSVNVKTPFPISDGAEILSKQISRIFMDKQSIEDLNPKSDQYRVYQYLNGKNENISDIRFYKITKDGIRNIVEEHVKQTPISNYIGKGSAYRDAKYDLVKIPFKDHSFFQKYEGFHPEANSCSYKTSNLPKKCLEFLVSSKDGNITLKSKTLTYTTSNNNSKNIQVFVSKDAIDLQNESIEYLHEFVFNPKLWAITIFKNGKIIARVKKNNFYLFDPIKNQKSVKDTYYAKPNCEFSNARYILEKNTLEINDCEGSHEISSYY